MQVSLSNWPAVGKYLEKRSTVIVPLGSTEQHGPNGLLGTDYLIAEHIAAELGARTGIMVAPVLPYGMSVHHMGFPGTMTLRPSTYQMVVIDLLSGLIGHGFSKFFLVNGHGGNIASIQNAMAELSMEEEFEYALVSWWTEPDIKELCEELFDGRDGHHGSAGEISMTMHLHPDAVEPMDSPWKEDASDPGWTYNPAGFRKMYPNGLIKSDPSLSTARHGAVLFQKIIDIYLDRIARFERG
ncbi:creatininase family protein [bacterium]|nr:creatininase family protein [candidate division CSSED10-310 bacterium]